MSSNRIAVDNDEVFRAVKSSNRPIAETAILLSILSDRGMRMKEKPGETPTAAIRKHFNISSLRRALHQLEQQGVIEVLTGAEWHERGRDFYDQRPTGRYWHAVGKAQPETKQPVATVLRVAPSPRQLIHLEVCKDVGACRFVGGAGDRKACRQLDALLDYSDEMLLHDKASELYSAWEKLPRGRNVHGPGVTWSVRQVDPFEEVDDDGVIDILSPKSVTGYPNCPACEKGTKHYHRKSDDSIVKAPTKEATGE